MASFGLATGQKMIEAAQSALKSFVANKSPISAMLDVIKQEDLAIEGQKPKPNVVVNSPEGKIALTIDLTHKELGESVDSRYAMPEFRRALASLSSALAPIDRLQKELSYDKQQANDDSDGVSALAFNRKISLFVGRLYRSQDTIKRDLIILETNLANLRLSAFRASEFYFSGYYSDLEQRIIGGTEPILADARQKYMALRARLMLNVGDASRFVKLMNSKFRDLFDMHKQLMYYYNTADAGRGDMKKLDQGVLAKLDVIINRKISIKEQLDFILREINEFEKYRPQFKDVFDTAETTEESPMAVKVVEQSVVKREVSNIEDFFKKKEQQEKLDSMQLAIEKKLAKGEIKMEDITDTDMANRIIMTPLLKSKTGIETGAEGSVGFGVI